MPTLQQMRYLVAVADALHFRRAAEATHVTQPTLSAQLKEMESRLGVQLVERSRSRVILTPIGEEIAGRARNILRDVEEMREVAKIGQQPLHGTIRVGVVQTLGPYLLPLLVPDLHASHPDLRLYVREGLAEVLIDRLEGGALDLLFFPLPIRQSDIETEVLFREPLLVVAPQEHRLAQKEKIARRDLKGETVLTLEPGHRLYEQVREICAEFEADLSHDFEGTSLDTLRQMVAMGMGLSLLPALYVRSEVARENLVVARPMSGPAPSRMIGIAWRRGTVRDLEFRELGSIVRGILKERAPEIMVIE